ncbi:MAG: terminase small subunit [Rhodospirillales bacterium]|nr:terminase small subunit [Alphaproteobacteria bacterium]MBL6947048.1 terminase small subunit [Rhodospirillales bacterium]
MPPPTSVPVRLPAAPVSGPTPAVAPAPERPVLSPAPAAKKLRHRHEAFCQHFVLCGTATIAAIKAGYSRLSAHNQGYRLMRHPAIQARIAEIHSRLAHAYCLDTDVLLGKLEAVYQRAHETRQFGAAARAVEIQARIARQIIPKQIPGELKTRGGERSLLVRDRESKMMRNDEFSQRPADGFPAKSTACAASGRRK